MSSPSIRPSLLTRVLTFAIAVVVALAIRYWLHPGHAPAAAPAPPASVAPAAAPAAPGAHAFGAGVGFRSHARLAEHFARHGAEVGATSEADYLVRAQALRDRPAGGDVLEQARADGASCRFDRASGDFLAFGPDGVIRTFFRPHDGERYFERQLTRSHDAP